MTEGVVLLTGAAGLVDNAVNEPPVEGPCETVWEDNSEFSCRLEDNGEAIENMKEDNIVRKDNDNIVSGILDFVLGGSSGGGNDDNSNTGYDYEPGSSVEESSSGWSIFGWSGASEDYRVDTSSDSDSSDYSSNSDSGGDSGGDGGSSWW